ncbi:hypothetical protein [Klebsiella pneumoniae]|uniref:hypothetical protein n=1 Tax=Klebsiella pneumoniae TaxID=573 RepID=UPI000E2CFB3C|nr:hypothetical protein [Klebsiella pneumoniae]SVZ53999.1 Uncharacterised protein [Klebsiella pneumoniae]
MNNNGLTLNQLTERNAALVTEVDKLRAERDQLAAENVEAKKIITECREYFIAGVMNRIRPTNEGYLHMICDTFADETPATDRIVSGIKAEGAEACVRALVTSDDDDFTDAPNICAMVAYQLRDGGNGE